MRLGIVGLLPGLCELEASHLDAVSGLNLTGFSLNARREVLFDLTSAELAGMRSLIESSGLDLVQFGINYGECLFDPDEGVRQHVTETIERGIEVGVELGAHVSLIRPGSLNPSGSYAPSPDNHRPDCRKRILETLGAVAAKAEAEDATVVAETHMLTLMDSPETNAELLGTVGSGRLKVVMDYVNHLQTLSQVYNSTERLNHIFDIMGPISAVGHYKDALVSDGLVLHIDEALPGEGELDLVTVLRRWDALYPDGYMLLEHLPNEKYPTAAANAFQHIRDAGVSVH